MKPEDLMIGDWVLLFDKTPIKVEGIGNSKVTHDTANHECDTDFIHENDL